MLNLGARRLVRPEITKVDLNSASKAYEQLAAGALTGRAVVIPSS